MTFKAMTRVMQALAVLALLGLVSVFVLVLWAPDLLTPLAERRNWQMPLSQSFTGPLVFASLMFFAPGLYALWQIIRLFGHYARGDCLSPDVIDRITRMARALFLLAFLNIFWGPAMDLLHMLILSPDHGSISVAVTLTQVLALLAGGLLLAIARALDEGYRALVENKAFV